MMKRILLIMALTFLALQGVGHSAHQSSLLLGLGLTLSQTSGAAPAGDTILMETGSHILAEDGTFILKD